MEKFLPSRRGLTWLLLGLLLQLPSSTFGGQRHNLQCCRIYGEPRVFTFDDLWYSYQAVSCPYLASRPTLSGLAASPACDFQVKILNAGTARGSILGTVEFLLNDRTVRIVRDFKTAQKALYVDNALISGRTWKGDFRLSVDNWIIRSSCGIIVDFSMDTDVYICLPRPFYGANKLEGVCGTMDDNCQNDARYSNGFQTHTLVGGGVGSRLCTLKFPADEVALGDSWRMNSIAGIMYNNCPSLSERWKRTPAPLPPTPPTTPAVLVPPAQCTFDCAELTNTRSCETCRPDYLVQRIHPISGCLTTACRQGRFQGSMRGLYGAQPGQVVVDYLTCDSGRWAGFVNGRRVPSTPNATITCMVGTSDTCVSCSEPRRTAECPPSSVCNSLSVVAKHDLETGCSIRRCPMGKMLTVRYKSKWITVDSVDCHRKMHWRVDGFEAMPSSDLLITCVDCKSCMPMTTTSLACTERQVCEGRYLRRRAHFRNGCQVMACDAGQLQVEDGGRRLFFDFLSCASCGKWTGLFEGKRYFIESTRPATCAQTQSGCSMCPSPAVSVRCPIGKQCDTKKLMTCTHDITGCLLYSCEQGYELFVRSNRGWEPLDFIDCSLSNGWRLEGLEFVENKIEITCAPGNRLREHLKECKPLFGGPTTTPAPKDACSEGCLRKDWLPIARKSCAAISNLLQDEAKQGPFSQCKILGEENIKELLRQCCFETCEMPEEKCARLGTFADECKAKSTSINLDNWQRHPLVNCTSPCPPNASFKQCGTACDRTCSSSDGNKDCKDECVAGCGCNIGFLRDDSQSDLACIRREKCGCSDERGAYPEGKTWLSQDCRLNNTCSKHKITSTPLTCSPNSECRAVEGERRCVCKEGFEGDGKVCKEREDCKKRCGEHDGRGKCVTDRVSGTGSTACSCTNNWSGPTCSHFTPRTDCAALKKYHNISKSGVYEIMPLVDSDLVVKVRCDMETSCGGWTLVSGSFKGASSCNTNTFIDYVRGFGDPEKKDVWIGLDMLSAITTANTNSLRVELTRCDNSKSECEYQAFSVLDKTVDYRVNMTQECEGSERDRSKKDGWLSWDISAVGPPFGYVDRAEYRDPNWCNSRYSSSPLPNEIRLPSSGWWFDEKSGFSTANLNAPPGNCEDAQPAFIEYVSVRKSLLWNKEPLREAFMWIRPTDFKC